MYYEKKITQDDRNNIKYIEKGQQQKQSVYPHQQQFQQSQQVRNTKQREQRQLRQMETERKEQKQIKKQKYEQFILIFQMDQYETSINVIQHLQDHNNLTDLFSNLRICGHSYESYTNLLRKLGDSNQYQYQQQINVILSGSSFNTQIFERCTLLQLYQNSIEDLKSELKSMYDLFSTLNLLDYHALKQSSIASVFNLIKVIELYNHTVQNTISSICNDFDCLLQKIFSSAQLLEWRQIPIYPVALEFQRSHMQNQLFGKLEILPPENNSFERYVDYHFNLIREDYILEFKEAIITLNEKGFEDIDKQKTSQIKLYQDLELLQVQMNNFQIMWKIQVKQFNMDGRELKYIDWEKSNYLSSGSLICLTNIECYPLIFGVITKRDKNQSEYLNGKIQLEFSFIDPNTSIMQFFNLFSQKTILINYEGLVEPIFFYLEALKQKQEMPFSNIIIENQIDVNYPKYLNKNSKFEIDLSNNNECFRGKMVNLLQQYWPQLDSTLDESQLNSIKLMLQKEVALIQGPPGTGKTYCGALAVRLLYQNLQDNDLPILIVCYTNHALDQFLDHIIKFVPLQYVARLGGVSKHPELQQCQIKCRERVDFEFKTFNELKNKISKIAERMLNYNYTIRPKDVKKYWPDLYSFIILSFFQDNTIDVVAYKKENGEEELVEYWIESSTPQDNTIVEGQLNGMSSYFQMDQIYQKKEQFQNLIKNSSLQNQQFDSEEEDQNVYLDSEDEAASYYDAYKDVNFDIDAINNAINQFNEKHQNYQLLHYDFQSIQKLINSLIYQDLNPWHINPNDIDQILIYLESLRYQNDSIKFSRLYKQFVEQSNKLKELYDEKEISILNSMRIVGVTVTGVAKQAKKLQQLNSKIMVIEEAAEVLESHVASILTSNLQQLILIGDHQQLKPKLKNYCLQQKLKNADVSLFERLFLNKIPSVTLNQQRRMKTKFADFIRLIYGESYYDHRDIQNQNNIEIRGLEKDLVFFNHKWPEASDEKSKENTLEAQMIFQMVQYLLQCNYEEAQISILTLYLKQAQVIKKLFLKSRKNIIVQTVDNYQGEQNDIVIISLVRNNKKNKLGYINIENRINVALSRARLGLYVFGNFDFIYNASSNNSLWQKIIQLAKYKECLTDYINTKCVSHGNLQKIQQPEDWKKIKPFLCNKKCLKMFSNCQHLCNNDCHLDDYHPAESCPFQCDQILGCGHKCKELCREQCKCTEIIDLNLPCGHKLNKTICGTNPQTYKCLQEDEIKFPKCFHIQKFTCYQREKYIHNCLQQCQRIHSCGHNCKKICFEDCGDCLQECQKVRSCGHNSKCANYCFQECSLCDTPVQTELVCGHTTQFSCFSQKKDLLSYLCQQNCIKQRICGHYQQICENKCHEECSPCQHQIERQLKCGHYIMVKCFEADIIVQETKCVEICEKQRQCGHDQVCLNKCYQECSPCQIMIQKTHHCGHSYQIECHKQNQEYQCQEICTRTRDCNHDYKCTNLCFEQCSPCNQIINHTLQCGRSHDFVCHSFNNTLQQFICHEPCLLKRQCGHTTPCLSICYENKCSPCLQIVNKKLDCGHIIQVKCCEFKEIQICQEPCVRIRECYHVYPCNKLCREVCQPCEQVVLKTLPCTHQHLVKCYQYAQPIICKEECIKIRQCGHYFPCTKMCNENCTLCESIILLKLKCGHEIDFQCNQSKLFQSNYKCQQQCIKIRQCGHDFPCYNICLTNKECTPCQADTFKQLSCGHYTQIKCFQMMYKLQRQCDQPCNKLRPCGHNVVCENKCYETCSPCTYKCEILLKCGHKEFVNCFQKVDENILRKIICLSPCNKKRDCGHNSICTKNCSQQCDPCSTKVQIVLNCGHFYKALCQQDPRTIICLERCKLQQICGHLCKSFCGKPCLRCEEVIIKKFPSCNHQLIIKCYESNKFLLCQELIQVGYSCQRHETQVKCCDRRSSNLQCPDCRDCIIF